MTKLRDEQQQIDNDEISLKELIQKIQEWTQYLKTQWKLIIGIAALGGIIGFVYASFFIYFFINTYWNWISA